MRNASALAGILLLACSQFAPPAHAAESYDGCAYEITSLPVVITTQGTWCMKADRSTALATGAAIIISTNNVTLDCNHFKLGGLGAGPGTEANGVQSTSKLNVTVRHCNIRGFRHGISGTSLVNPTIEDNVFEFNTRAGIWLETGTGSLVQRNRIRDTGGSTAQGAGSVYGMRLENDMDVLDNIISGVEADNASLNASVFGIYTSGATGTLSGNRIRGLFPVGTGTANGIYNASSGRQVIEGNVVDNGGLAQSVGVRCSGGLGVAAGNRLLGTATGVVNCSAIGNYSDAN